MFNLTWKHLENQPDIAIEASSLFNASDASQNENLMIKVRTHVHLIAGLLKHF